MAKGSSDSRSKETLLAEIATQQRKLKKQDLLLKRMSFEIEEYKERVEELNNNKREFIDKVAFGIRSFVTLIQVPLKLMTTSQLSSENQKRIYIINKNVKYLNNLVNNVLDVAKLEGGLIIGSTKSSLIDIINIAIGQKQSRMEKEGIKLTVSIDQKIPKLWLDKEKLMRVITHILENATLCIGTGKKEIDLTVKIDGKNIVVAIKDSGIGMDKQTKEHIFDSFYSKSPNCNVAGLGMSISKRIIEAHGGTLIAESPGVGKGSIITLSLPIKNEKLSET